MREPRGEYNLRVLGALVHGIEARLGAEGLQEVAAAAGVRVDELRAGRAWVALSQVEAALARAAHLLGDDENLLREACAASMAQAYGAMRYVLWAARLDWVLVKAMRTVHLVSTNSAWEITEHARHRMRVRYRAVTPESRYMCVLRQANIIGLPRMWGLPAPHFVEHKCMAHGDDCCEYEGWWPARRGWLWPLLATLAGAGVGAILGGAGLSSPVLAPLLALVAGGLVSYLDLLRTQRQNQDVAQRSVEALQQLAEDERQARLQALDLSARQQAFVESLDQQIAQRTRVLEQTLHGVQQLHLEQTVQMRGAAHDLRNPLAAIVGNAEALREVAQQLPASHRGISDDLTRSAQQVRLMADELVRLLRQEVQADALKLEPLVIPNLVETLRRRLSALVRNPEIRVTVFATREAPDLIDVDTVRLDRVLDNLLGNAAKYTQSGSILVEISGTPECMVIKIGDSGRGIADEHFAQVFRPGGSAAEERAPDSHGLGLSVVVRLLAEMGGRLEVLSNPGKGTTFWVYLPRQAPERAQPQEVVKETEDDLMARVVTIRRHAS